MKILALDIGGTAVKYGFFNETPEFGEFPVKNGDGTESLPEKIIDFISRYDADFIGICAPGPFDFESGTGLMEHKLKSLYKVSLREKIERFFPDIKLLFIHDSTAFILGEICNNSALSTENIAGIMLGTGLGYVHSVNARVEVNESETPLKPLWSKPYKDGIAENYVSATAIINKALKQGFCFKGVKELADKARQGNRQLLELFSETGAELGQLITEKCKEDGFERLVIGGQVSGAWDLMKAGFEKCCKIPYIIAAEPAKSPLYGIKYCVENGKENIYLKR